MITFLEAMKTVFLHIGRSGSKPVGLKEANGYFLAEEINSDTDLPLADNSAMDGYAVISAETTGASEGTPVILRLIGNVPAGRPFRGRLKPGQTLYIATGGVIPEGADAVVPVEHSTHVPPATVIVFKPAQKHDHIRFAGEELKRTEPVLPPHTYLGPAQLGVLAAVGATTVKVFNKPAVAFLATGDELIAPARKPRPGQVRNSNAVMIGKMVANYGFRFKDLGVAGDNAASQVKKLKDLIMPEVLLTSAGVSAGKYDIVADTLTSLGLEVLIRKVALKPGKPLVFGKIGRTLYFGLPGNPVSAAVVYKLFVEPALLMMAGSLNPFPVLFPAVSESTFKETGGRLHFARGFCYYENGWRVKTTGHQGSHIISSMAAANCLIPIPPAKSIKPGNTVMVQMLEGQRVSYEATFRAFSEWLS